MKLTSRDCCPYLDDFEPDYLPAVAAIAPEDKQTISGDPKGPTFVEPLTASIHMRLPDGGSAAAEAGFLAHSWSNSDYDAGKNSSGSDNYDSFDFRSYKIVLGLYAKLAFFLQHFR